MPSRKDIERQQKLLVMYRNLLADYLREQQEWPRLEVPEFLRTGIEMLRSHIVNVKGTLRGWKVEVKDHNNDQGPNDDIVGDIQHQYELLKIYRGNLAIDLQNQQHFAMGQIPPMLINSIYKSRTQIQRIKAILRGWGVVVDDLPEEEISESGIQ
jgi:hypothetical protein